MRQRLQYTEKPEVYYERLWKISRASLKDLIKIYELNKDIGWKYRHFAKWMKDCYRFKISGRQWRHFIKYYNLYKKRKHLKLPPKVKVNW